MFNKFCFLCVIILLSVNCAYAIEANTKKSTPPAPPFKEPVSGMDMVFVKGGCYMMGDIYGDGVTEDGDLNGPNEEKPVHEVCVDDFYIGKYEVTQGEWKTVMGANPASYSTCSSDNCPIDNVSWDDVQGFIGKLNSKSGENKYRLPTEAEWEYAARSGGKNERYAGGNDVSSVSWHDVNSGYRNQDTPNKATSHPVGKKMPNGLGIYDMSGNAWEMTGDWFEDSYYTKSPRKNPNGPSEGTSRVKRGGCATGFYINSRTSRRSSYEPGTPNHLVGFRLLKTP